VKFTKTFAILPVLAILALVANASSPTPSPAPQRSPTTKASPPSKATPPTKESPASPANDLAVPSEQPAPIVASTPSATPPNPILYLLRLEYYTTGGKNWVRYRYDVLNKADYAAGMFAAAPTLPPCGSNTNSSRTWVDFYTSTGKRLYGFCALSKPDDLGKIWFALEEGVIPPSYVYIELNDRQTNTKYKSNLADTTL
jgi:hypothetical protein